MLEKVLDFGKGRLFVEKFFVLQRGKQAVEFVFGLCNDLTTKLNGNSRPMTANCWRKAFSSGARRSMRAANTPCTVGECGGRSVRCVEPVRAPPYAAKNALLGQVWTTSSMKKGVPSVFSRMSCLRA